MNRPRVLVIAGSDSSGGAGVVRDLEVLASVGVAASVAITAVTAQTDTAVRRVHLVPAEIVSQQVETAFADGGVGAVKIGMTGSAQAIAAAAEALRRNRAAPVVLDPVLASSSGRSLVNGQSRRATIMHMFPLVTLLTPNSLEAAILTGGEPAAGDTEAIAQARRLLALGPRAVLMKGGHRDGPEAVDILVRGGAEPVFLRAPRVPGTMRGTGCALSSAIAAGLAKGLALEDACRAAKQRVHRMIANEPPRGKSRRMA